MDSVYMYVFKESRPDDFNELQQAMFGEKSKKNIEDYHLKMTLLEPRKLVFYCIGVLS